MPFHTCVDQTNRTVGSSLLGSHRAGVGLSALVVPRSSGRGVGAVLGEQQAHVMPGRSQSPIQGGRNHHLNQRPATEG